MFMRPICLLALLPLLGFFVEMFFANRIEPYVLGMTGTFAKVSPFQQNHGKIL